LTGDPLTDKETMNPTAPGVGWLVRVPRAGWLLHARRDMSATAPCGACLVGAWQADVKAVAAHRIPLCPVCFNDRRTGARP
jgi:hypothetical protein